MQFWGEITICCYSCLTPTHIITGVARYAVIENVTLVLNKECIVEEPERSVDLQCAYYYGNSSR